MEAHAAQVTGKDDLIAALRADLERTTATAEQERQSNRQLTADVGKLQADLDNAKSATEQERQKIHQQADTYTEQLKIKDEAISKLQSELVKATSIDGLMERISALQKLIQPEKERVEEAAQAPK